MQGQPIIIITGKDIFESVNNLDQTQLQYGSKICIRNNESKQSIRLESQKTNISKKCFFVLLIFCIMLVAGVIIQELWLRKQQIQKTQIPSKKDSNQQNRQIKVPIAVPQVDEITTVDNISQPIRNQLQSTSQSLFTTIISQQSREQIYNITKTTLQDVQLARSNYQAAKQSQSLQKTHSPFTEHTHSPLTFKYATMGMQKPNTTFNFTEVDPKQYYQYEQKMDRLFKPYNDTDCELQRFGDSGDGGYLLCKNKVNQSVALINLGVEGRDMFGCQLTSAFPMPNYQYDCTTSLQTQCLSNNNRNAFEFACLGQSLQYAEGHQYYSLKDIVNLRNLTKRHVIMKIDVEGAEWSGFRTFPIQYLDYVDQLVMQFHNPAPNIRHKAFWGNIDIIESLERRFVSVNLHSNTGSCYLGNSGNHKLPAFALEVTLVNRNIINLKSFSRSYNLHEKNALNGGGFNCQMQD